MYPMDEVPLLTFSNEWLGSFKARYGIQEYKPHGESGSTDVNAIEQRPEIANQYPGNFN